MGIFRINSLNHTRKNCFSSRASSKVVTNTIVVTEFNATYLGVTKLSIYTTILPIASLSVELRLWKDITLSEKKHKDGWEIENINNQKYTANK